MRILRGIFLSILAFVASLALAQQPPEQPNTAPPGPNEHVTHLASPAQFAQPAKSADILPKTFGGWTIKGTPQISKDPAAADPSNAALLKEYGFTDLERNVAVVAWNTILYGILMLIADMVGPQEKTIANMTLGNALLIGVAQALALIPGTSRSGATIIGGMLLGLSRKAATDFSFFLAIPTMISAGGYSLWKERNALSMADMPMFAVGFIVSFLAAWACVRWLLRYVSSHTFVPFAWYRIAFGIVVLATWVTGTVIWAD